MIGELENDPAITDLATVPSDCSWTMLLVDVRCRLDWLDGV